MSTDLILKACIVADVLILVSLIPVLIYLISDLRDQLRGK